MLRGSQSSSDASLTTAPRVASLAALVAPVAPAAFAQTKPDKDYLVYVLSEAADTISLIRFGPGGARVDHEVPTGDMPIDIDGPHGIAISRDKEFYYVSLAHGRPFGSVWKYSTKDDRVLGHTTAGLVSRHDGSFTGWLAALRREFQFARRHGAFISFRSRYRADAGSRAHSDLHDAAWLAPESAGNQTLFSLHDGRHAGGNRHCDIKSFAPFPADERPRDGHERLAGSAENERRR